jgi:outer membrane protein TolC
VSRGAAVGTDVLQAKNALAGAMTARVASQGAYRQALNAFNTVFGFEPENVNALLPIRVPNLMLPADQEVFRALVLENSGQMATATIAYDMAMVDRDKAAAANFLPAFNLTAEANYKGDASGTLGGKTEYIAKVEMTWPLELFGTQINSYRASKIRGDSAAITYKQAKKGVENSITSTWNSYELASLNRANVQNQVNIAEQFLRLAQMEVQQGRGQMMLVMNAQSALINARKALQDNTSDYAVQVYSLLSQTGQLSVENLQAAADEEEDAYRKSVEEYRARIEAANEDAAAANDENSSGTESATE